MVQAMQQSRSSGILVGIEVMEPSRFRVGVASRWSYGPSWPWDREGAGSACLFQLQGDVVKLDVPEHDYDNISLIDNFAVERNAELLQQEPCIFVLAGCSVNSDIQALKMKGQ